MMQARNLPYEKPLIFPGVVATVMRESEPAKNRFIVLSGAENRTRTIGDPASDEQQIGDMPPREDEEMFAGKRKRRRGLPAGLVSTTQETTPSDPPRAERLSEVRMKDRKVGMAQKKVSPEIQRLWDARLRHQVDVTFDRQFSFMVRHGLNNSGAVLDAGTGNGYFCCKVATERPNTHFTGVDFSGDMLVKAEKTARRLSVSNVGWLKGDIAQPMTSLRPSSFDGIILRYADFHMPEQIDRVLTNLGFLLKPGGRIWVYSVEFNFMKSTPEHPIYNLYKNRTLRFYDTFGMDPHHASKMPAALVRNGFVSVVSERDPMSNRDMGTTNFQRFMIEQANLCRGYDPSSFSEEDVNTITDFAKKIPRLTDFYGTHGVVMISAVKGKQKFLLTTYERG